MTVQYSNNFDALTAGTLPAGWVNSVGAWQVTSSAPVSGTKAFASTTSGDGNVALYTGIAALADMEVAHDFIVSVSGTTLPNIGQIVRMDAAFTNGYAVVLDSTDGATYRILLFKRVASTFSPIGAPVAVSFTCVAGDVLHIATRIVGTSISVYVWKNATTRPTTANVTGTDSAITAAGYAGLYNAVGTSGFIPSADNFSVDNLIVAGSVPGAPTIGTATAGNTSASITFTAGTAGATATTSYLATSTPGGFTGTSATSSITVSGLTNGTTYTFTVHATNTSGNSPESAISNSVAPVAATNNALLTASVLFSPYNWNLVSNTAKTINAGAYFKTLFGGTACSLNFDMTGLVAPFPEILYRIDKYGPWITANIAATLVLTIPTDTADYATKPGHYLEVIVKSTTETQNRWTPQATAVSLTGILLDAGKILTTVPALPLKILYYGDSITEGVRTVNGTATNDTDRNDASQGWAYRSAEILGAEAGIVGFGATGLVTAGSGGVPAITASYNFLYSGVSRTFATIPDAIIINEGTNDGAAATTTAVTTLLNGLIAATPAATKIIVLRPFNGNQAANLQAGIAACTAPARCFYVDTTGYFTSANSFDATHPYGVENITHIAPLVATAIRSVLAGMPTLIARTVTVTLGDSTGALANLTGLKVAFYDEATPDLLTTARYKTAIGATNATGVLTFSVNSTLASGGTGHVTVLTATGQHFNGSVVVA